MASERKWKLTLAAAVLLGVRAFSSGTEQKAAPPVDDGSYSLEEERRIMLAVRARDRRDLVRPPPPGFKSEPVQRKLRLTLVARDKKIRVGESFWYRLEVQNVGRTLVHILDEPSFLKDGSDYANGYWHFFATAPDETRKPMVIGRLYDEFDLRDTRADAVPVPGADKMTDLEVQQYIRRDYAFRLADRELRVVLDPGETLVSKAWRWVPAKERLERKARGEPVLTPRPAGDFRELWTDYRFSKPGRYTVQAVFDDPMRPVPHEVLVPRMRKHGYTREELGADHKDELKKESARWESNPVVIEVVR